MALRPLGIPRGSSPAFVRLSFPVLCLRTQGDIGNFDYESVVAKLGFATSMD